MRDLKPYHKPVLIICMINNEDVIACSEGEEEFDWFKPEEEEM